MDCLWNFQEMHFVNYRRLSTNKSCFLVVLGSKIYVQELKYEHLINSIVDLGQRVNTWLDNYTIYEVY